MQFLQSPVTGDQKSRLNSGRKPLQPKNSEPVQISTKPLPLLPDLRKVNFGVSSGGGKENQNLGLVYDTPPASKKLIQQPSIPPIDSSLAEELSVMRKRMERLRSDREKTEKMLKERDRVLDLQMKEMEARAEAQMTMEMEVDRLFRLKELHTYSMTISPLRSLRDKEQERKLSRRYDEKKMVEEEQGSSGLQQRGNDSPCCSSTSSNSISTPTQQQLVAAV
ncbi:unnamed protein product [Linum tenue]|uniref:Uncharacterized protein n=1 Tax=Linum tenue TaxID=586396 RepID=A0AAV0PUX4_9ROSI|nr:unnamed protein product [Linum tenue]